VLVNPTAGFGMAPPSIAREGQTITLTFNGVPGDRVALLTGARTTFRELAVGPVFVEPGRRSLATHGPVGTIGQRGILAVSYVVPGLPPGVGAQNLWLQGLATHADGKRTMGSFTAVTVIDSGL